MGKPSAVLLLIAGAIGLWLGLPNQYWLIWAAIVGVGTGAASLTGWFRFPRKQMCLVKADNGQYRLLPRLLREERFWSIAIPLAIAVIAGLILAGRLMAHFRPLPTLEQTFVVMVIGLALTLAAHLIYSARIARQCKQPRLTITTDEPGLDEPFQLRIDIETDKPVHLDRCQAMIFCFEHVLLHLGRFTHVVVRPHGEKIVTLTGELDLAAGSPGSASAQVLLESASHVPTGKKGISMYPFYHWEIQVQFTGDDCSTTIYPLTVKGPRPA